MKSNREWFTLLTDKEQERFKRNCDGKNGYGFDKYMKLESLSFKRFIEGTELWHEPFDYYYSNEPLDYWKQISESNRELKDHFKEELISFDTAKLAKDKGFPQNDIKIIGKYREDGSLQKSSPSGAVVDRNQYWYERPTQTLLQKWLREIHNIHVWTYPHINNDMYYGVRFYKKESNQGWIDAYKTCEEALEKGLFEALKLIK